MKGSRIEGESEGEKLQHNLGQEATGGKQDSKKIIV
jgi:hypothetical protein